MFHPAASGVLLSQGLVEGQEIMVTSRMGFSFQASPPPPLGNLQSLPPTPEDANPGQFGASSSAQISSSHIWPWTEEGAVPKKKEASAGGASNKNKIKKKSSIIISNNDSIVEGLSIGAIRMKKVKARKKVREPRFCFKTMSDIDVLDDGYKWRKYGQKVVKNTQHPRSYYRCTQDNCRVKKRIERLAEDPRMVITTYEGRHVHSPSHDEDESQANSSKINLFW